MNIPPTHKVEDCICGGLHPDEGFAPAEHDIVCPACDGVDIVEMPKKIASAVNWGGVNMSTKKKEAVTLQDVLDESAEKFAKKDL